VKQVKKQKPGCCCQISPTGKGPRNIHEREKKKKKGECVETLMVGKRSRTIRQVLKSGDKFCWVGSYFCLPASYPHSARVTNVHI
jgi:hypothetical protein